MARKKLYCVMNERGEEILTPVPGKYAGWRKGKIFGLPTCKSGMRMKEENRVWFTTRKACLNAHYRPCKICKP